MLRFQVAMQQVPLQIASTHLEQRIFVYGNKIILYPLKKSIPKLDQMPETALVEEPVKMVRMWSLLRWGQVLAEE